MQILTLKSDNLDKFYQNLPSRQTLKDIICLSKLHSTRK